MGDASAPGAYEQVYQAIIRGEIKPGDRLRETELAEQIGLSRTPIREAIRKLESDGIVEHQPRVGAMVKKLSQQEIVELYEMRIVIEGTAAQMAAQHISDAEIATLRAINDEIAQGGAPDQSAKLNRDFHSCILHAARNRYLVQSFQGLAHHFILLGATTIESETRLSEVVAQHQTIIAALRDRDPDAAMQSMRDHMETSLLHRLKGLRA
jgi:DNA-binding GntR family transcriptional regulator